VDVVYPPVELLHLLAQSDVVVAAVPETDETRRLMGPEAFGAMKDGAFFVNVGRGSLVDEAALVEALESGRLRGAALDVTDSEPLGPADPLWAAPNLYLSAHVASDGRALFRSLRRLFEENVGHYLRGEPLRNEVVLHA
jgi:phosphoglycerate dehydrogenase-like enzyme